MAKEISDYVAEIEKQIGEGQRQYQPEKQEEEESPAINGAKQENPLDIF
jgi:hypothetical protein